MINLIKSNDHLQEEDILVLKQLLFLNLAQGFMLDKSQKISKDFLMIVNIFLQSLRFAPLSILELQSADRRLHLDSISDPLLFQDHCCDSWVEVASKTSV